MKKINNFIWVSFQKEGIHCYPAAATDEKLATGGWDDVSFLGTPHRHMFHFKISIEVFTDDRDIEFIQFKRWIERLYSGDILQLDHKSCEMISDELYMEITKKYPNRKIIIEVSEDGENGSCAEYDVDPSDLDVQVKTIETDGNEPRKIYFVELGEVNHNDVIKYVDKIKESRQSEIDSAPKSKVDSHLELTFDQTMNKLDKVTETPDLRVKTTKTSWWTSLKHTVQTLFGI